MNKILTYKGFGTIMLSSLLMAGCSKGMDVTDAGGRKAESAENSAVASLGSNGRKPILSQYTTYTIQKGNNFCDQSTLKSVRTSEMKFMAIFDASAIYSTIDPVNQYDINKLWGFSEGFDNQYNSARIGWNWYNNALHLHAYVYNKGVRLNQEIGVFPIGSEINCSIKVSANTYIFTINGTSVVMSRGLSTTAASGYQQYPYFGGDEVAPQTITIKIRSL